uniref:Uncharacterized protein n=1 Tax=Micrurus lemniscatus lemniscatus TaxID=129467 RepID=A0A2D4IT09_MICLE
MYNIYKMYLIQRKIILKIRRHQHVAHSPSQKMDKALYYKTTHFPSHPFKKLSINLCRQGTNGRQFTGVGFCPQSQRMVSLLKRKYFSHYPTGICPPTLRGIIPLFYKVNAQISTSSCAELLSFHSVFCSLFQNCY